MIGGLSKRSSHLCEEVDYLLVSDGLVRCDDANFLRSVLVEGGLGCLGAGRHFQTTGHFAHELFELSCSVFAAPECLRRHSHDHVSVLQVNKSAQLKRVSLRYGTRWETMAHSLHGVLNGYSQVFQERDHGII